MLWRIFREPVGHLPPLVIAVATDTAKCPLGRCKIIPVENHGS